MNRAKWVLVGALAVAGLLTGGLGCTQPAPTATLAATPTSTPNDTKTFSAPTPALTPTPTSRETKTLLVGVTTPLSGSAAPWGQVHLRGADLSVDDINNKGGITVGGQKYLLTTKAYDYGNDMARGLENINRLIQADKATWIVTGGNTGITKAILPITERNKVILSFAGQSKDLMSVVMPMKYSFRWFNPDYAPVWKWLLGDQPQIKRVFALDRDDEAGWDHVKDTIKYALEAGFTDVTSAYYGQKTTDFYPLLTKELTSKPDLISLLGVPSDDIARIVKQARELGYAGKFIGGSVDMLTFKGLAGDEAMEDFMNLDTVDPRATVATPGEKAFWERYLAKYGTAEPLFILSVASGMYPIAQAIEKADSLDPDKIIQQLYGSTFDVLGREIRFGGVSVYGLPPRQALVPLMVTVWGKGVVAKRQIILPFPPGY